MNPSTIPGLADHDDKASTTLTELEETPSLLRGLLKSRRSHLRKLAWPEISGQNRIGAKWPIWSEFLCLVQIFVFFKKYVLG